MRNYVLRVIFAIVISFVGLMSFCIDIVSAENLTDSNDSSEPETIVNEAGQDMSMLALVGIIILVVGSIIVSMYKSVKELNNIH